MGPFTRSTLASLVAFGFAIVACSSSDEEPDDGFETFIKSYCDRLVGCCLPAGRRTADDCTAILRAKKPDLQFDRAKGDVCLEELAKRPIADSCKDTSTKAPACRVALADKSGAKKTGEACTKRSDCTTVPEGEVTCTNEVGGSVCEVTIAGKEGDGPCLGTLESGVIYEQIQGTRAPRAFTCDTAAGVYCNRTSTKCEKVGDIGGACEKGTVRACVRAAYCDATSKCAARVAVDASCATAECVREAKCDATQKCVALKSGSAICTESSECTTGYCKEGRCDELPLAFDPALEDVCLASAR